MKKTFTKISLLFIALLCFTSTSWACDRTNITLNSYSQNLDGSYTLNVNVCIGTGTSAGADPGPNGTFEFGIELQGGAGYTFLSYNPASVTSAETGNVGNGSIVGGDMLVYSTGSSAVLLHDENYTLAGQFCYNNIIINFTATTAPTQLQLFGGEDEDDGINAPNACTSETITLPALPTTTSVNCGGISRDPGGAANYANNQNVITFICPPGPGQAVSLTFSSFALENNGTGCYDALHIYNGPNTGSPFFGTAVGYCTDNGSGTDGTGYPGGALNVPMYSTDASGCITLHFTSDGSTVNTGWQAAVNCLSISITNAVLVTCTPGPPDTYSVSITVTYANLAAGGEAITISNGTVSQSFNTSGASGTQTFTLTGLAADGLAESFTVFVNGHTNVNNTATPYTSFTAPNTCNTCAAEAGTLTN